METKNLLKSLKRRLGLVTAILAMLAVSQGMLAMTVTKGEVIIVDVSGHNWFSNDNCYPKVYIGSTVVGQAGGFSSTKSYSITITTTATGTMQISRFTGSNEYNKSNVTDRSDTKQDKVTITGNDQWGGSWSNTKEYTYGQRYLYFDCTSAPDPYKSTLRLAYYWKASCDEGDGSGSTETFSTAATNIFYYDLNNFSTSYSYLRSFKTAQGSGWWNQACLTPDKSEHKNNCIKITGYGTQSWSTYVLTPTAVFLSVSSGASSGSGTSKDPYIVEPGAKFTLSASGVTYSPDDPNMSTRYGFGTSAPTEPTGESSTSEQTASSSEETKQYYVSVRGYYNSTYSKSYKSTSVYVQTKSACTTPDADDFTYTSSATYDGTAKSANVDWKSETGSGAITTYYEGTSGTSYTKSTDEPTNAGTYSLTIDVAAAGDYCAATGISLGNFVINQKTPTASDFSLSNNEKTYTGSALKPTFNKNTGVDCSFSKYYYSNDSGSTWTEYANGPTNAGTYTVKVDVSAGTNYSAATGIVLNSNFVINKATQATLTISNETKEVCNGSSLTLTTSGGSGTGAVTYDIESGGTGDGTISSSTFTGTSAGTVLIKATKAADSNFKEASSSNATFTVNPQNAIGSVTFDNSTIKKNATTTAHANDVVTSGATGSWSSDNTDVATVDASLGVVTGVSVGEANIIYTLPGGCNDTSKGAVNSKSAKISVLTDCDTPEAGTIGGTLNVCAGSGTTLTLTGYTTTGTTLQWYKDDAVITGATSNSYATGNLNASATYKVRVSKTASCYNDATAVTVTVTAIPTITNTNDGSRCGAGTVELQATASAGDVKWYSTSTSGTALKTGTSYTTPSISATTKYYVDATQNGCTTASRTAVTATVNTVPSISSIAASTEDSGCGTGTVKFTASGVSAGSTVHWYENSTKKGEGDTYNYTNVAAGSSVTLRAKAVHTNGCESEFTAPTTGTRKALPSLTTAPAGSAVTAYLWEPVNLTATTTDGTATVAISTTSTKYEVTDITNGKSLKAGNAGDTFTATYTATSTNGCQTQEVKTVTAAKATEDCGK